MKKWFRIFSFFLICCFALFFMADSTLIPWLSKINFYYKTHHKTFSEGYLKELASKDRKLIKNHVRAALSSLKKTDDHEIAAAINDYLFQFLQRDSNALEPVQVLKAQGAICGGNAHAMSAMLSECGIENRIAYMLDIPYQASHVLVEVKFKDGSSGLFDPTFGLYWFDPETNKHLSMDNLKANPSLAGKKIMKTKNQKRDSKNEIVSPFFSIQDHYQSFVDRGDFHYEELFNTYANAGLEGYSFKVFQKIPIKGEKTILGSLSTKNVKASRDLLSSKTNEIGVPICFIQQLGGHNINVNHIYELQDLTVDANYTLTLHYFNSIQSVLSATVLGGRFANTTKETEHSVVEDFGPKLLQRVPIPMRAKSRSISYAFTAETPNVNLIVDNSGDMALHAITLERVRE